MDLTGIFDRHVLSDTGLMCARAALVFAATLFLIRISGRRIFGMRTPVDKVIAILLGALLSRVIVGVSPFIPTVAAGLVIVLMYRLCAALSVNSRLFGKIVKGSPVQIFKNGRLLDGPMKDNMVTKDDLVEELRIRAQLSSLDEIDEAYVERTGEISIVKKKEQSPKNKANGEKIPGRPPDSYQGH